MRRTAQRAGCIWYAGSRKAPFDPVWFLRAYFWFLTAGLGLEYIFDNLRPSSEADEDEGGARFDFQPIVFIWILIASLELSS